ncbi:fumarate reductase [Levilactobacillus namurensis DSM 19117]|uniref:Fumarate reductase n=1 Tax=Levilactobacillus namurensis DSM 19117 TaxID=1423773 RepID=A0A0R1K0W9_9LACO|nr:FAD-dependent oxidoreductase [Levilactobacillus namurensis]KRK74484.1 fumarate reductase [Levilactobacillus namurensis DSM 19117]GEO74258.1 fumarate reductase [Levilactobacillus namurensis]
MSLTQNTAYDLVVVGTGAAGTSAALAAAENGATVLLLEKGRHTGGSSNYTEGLFAVDSYLQKEQGIHVSGTEVLKEEVGYSKFRADSRIWRQYIDHSADTVEWLKDQGVEYEGVQAMGAGEATWHIYKGMGNAVLHDALLPQTEKRGVEVLTQTQAVALKQDANHAITGVTIENVATQETATIATRAVVLATGGYLNNAKLMKKLTHYDTDRLVPVSSGKGTGDGLTMAWDAGAKSYGTGMAMLFGGYLKDPDEPSFKMMPSQMNTAAGQQPLLWVNGDGERFVDESVVYNFSYAGNALYTQDQVFSILDQATVDRMAKDGNFMGLGVYVKRGEKMDKLQAEMDQALAAKKPFIFKADSLEDLAAQMNLPVDQLTQTIDQYNQDCANGTDSLFGKDADYLVPVAQGPFYGFKLNVGAFCTMGGLQVTPDNQVLDTAGQVMPGLYAAGNDAAGLAGDTYGPNMPGTCVGYAFYSGRNSGTHAAKYVQSQNVTE